MARNNQPPQNHGDSSVRAQEGLTLKVEDGRAPMPRFEPGEFDRLHVAPDVIPLPVVQGGASEGRKLWRSPSELAGDTAMAPAEPEREFPMGAADFASDGIARRSFIQLLGGSLAVAGVSGCAYRPPDEKILPYTKKPEAVTPSAPLHFATSSTLGGLASGLLVRSYEGRPVKIEGNPLHPANPGGGSTAFEQAEILRMYDPHRAKELKQKGSSRAWKEFLEANSKRLEKLKAGRGAGLRFLMEPNGSPLLAALKTRLLEERFPLAKFYSYSPVSAAGSYEGAKVAFGQTLDTDFDLKQAKVVVSLDSDFLASFPGSQRLTHAFTAGREPGPNMNRLYVAESSFSVTGAFSDHRLRVKPSELGRLAVAIAIELEGLGAGALRSLGLKAVDGLSEAQRKWAKAVAKDLYAHRGAGAVLVGGRQPAALHALAQALNLALGNNGKAVLHRKPLLPDNGIGMGGLLELAGELEAGKVDTLVITAYNPVYAAPAELRFGELLAKVPNVVYWGLHEDETAKAAHWFIPAAHFLEAWGDAVGPDGSVSVVQPLIKPLFSGVSEADVLAACLNSNEGTYALLKEHWRKKVGNPIDFEARWETWLAEGRIPATEVALESAADLKGAEIGAAVQKELLAGGPVAAGTLELNVVPDYKLLDGRFANNAWMQELPDPISKLTWDNVAYLSEATAQRLDLSSGDLVSLSRAGRTVEAPVWVLPGHADDTVTVTLGYGRWKEGPEKVARGVGFDAYQLQSATTPWGGVGLQLAKTGRKHKLATTQEHWTIHLEQSGEGAGKKVNETRERDIAMETTLAKLQANPEFLEGLRGPQPMMYEPSSDGTYRWAMATDLSKCTGCNACVVACQSENNVPVVGKEGVSRGREMHWLRIDRYFSGSVEEPSMITQPVACVHCEMAPCEYVCPVNATVHDDEGLNEMVYNRCIGTRYCSNNCPYKVRRFNFLAYNTEKSTTEKMAMNPQVTVRARGVMEKCTYCVQRIEAKRIETRIEGRRIKDGELTPACAQACSGDALVFGDLNDPESRVSKLHRDPRRYDLLHHLATKPRTGYLARIKNPNPELV